MNPAIVVASGAVAVSVAGAVVLAKGGGGKVASVSAGRGRASVIRRALAAGRPLWDRRPAAADLAALARVVRGYEGAPDYNAASAALAETFATGADGPWPWSQGGAALQLERELANAIVDVAAAVITTPPNPWGDTAAELAEWLGGSLREHVIDSLDTCWVYGGGGWLQEHLPYDDYDWPYEAGDPWAEECEVYRRERRRLVPPAYRDGKLVVGFLKPGGGVFDFDLETAETPFPATSLLKVYRAALPALGRALVGRWGHGYVNDGERQAAWAALARIGS